MKFSTKLSPASRSLASFFAGYPVAAPAKLARGRRVSDRLRSSSPLAILSRADKIKRQKKGLPPAHEVSHFFAVGGFFARIDLFVGPI